MTGYLDVSPTTIVATVLQEDAEAQQILIACPDVMKCAFKLKEYCYTLPCYSEGSCRWLLLNLMDAVDWTAMAQGLLERQGAFTASQVACHLKGRSQAFGWR